MTIAKEILNQLGGNRFIAMTGSKNFIDGGNALSMHLPNNKLKASFLKIALMPLDLYKMTFTKKVKILDREMAKLGVKFYTDTLEVVKEINGIYCDQLQEIFTSITGLDTHL